MDFWRTLVVLVRRWYVTVPALVATLGLAGVAYSVVPVTYQSNAVLVLTTPLSGGTEATQPDRHPNPITNPLMNFDQSLALTASIVIQQLNSPDSAARLGIEPGGTTTYAVNNGSTNPELLQSGPFIFVQGEASSAAAAQDIAQRVATMADVVLADRQNQLNAPASTQIGMQVVVSPTAAQPLQRSRKRAAAAVLALAGVACLASAYAVESFATHRRQRRVRGAEGIRDTKSGTTLRRVVPDWAGESARGPVDPSHGRLVGSVAAAEEL